MGPIALVFVPGMAGIYAYALNLSILFYSLGNFRGSNNMLSFTSLQECQQLARPPETAGREMNTENGRNRQL